MVSIQNFKPMTNTLLFTFDSWITDTEKSWFLGVIWSQARIYGPWSWTRQPCYCRGECDCQTKLIRILTFEYFCQGNCNQECMEIPDQSHSLVFTWGLSAASWGVILKSVLPGHFLAYCFTRTKVYSFLILPFQNFPWTTRPVILHTHYLSTLWKGDCKFFRSFYVYEFLWFFARST